MKDQKFERQLLVQYRRISFKKISFSTIQNIKLSLVNNFDKMNMFGNYMTH